MQARWYIAKGKGIAGGRRVYLSAYTTSDAAGDTIEVAIGKGRGRPVVVSREEYYTTKDTMLAIECIAAAWDEVTEMRFGRDAY